MSIVMIEDRGAVRHVILNRPEKRNALNAELLHAFADALRTASHTPAVECVAVRGEGPVFSAGIDLKEIEALTTAELDMRNRQPIRALLLECANLCEEMTKPVICQIHNACVGAALEIAIACDFRVASSDSRFSLPEVRMGIIPDVGGLSRLPALVGLGAAKDLVMTARTIGAGEALRLGLVSRIAEPSDLAGVTAGLAQELLANSPHTAGRAKRVLDAAAHPALLQTLEMELITQEYCIALARERIRDGTLEVT